MRKLNVLYLFIPVLLFSCHQKDKRVIDTDKNIAFLPADDAKFLALKDTAQKYITELIKNFNANSGDTNYYFTLKSDYVQNNVHEHMWASPINFKENIFTCIFTDSAYNITNVTTGDTVFVSLKDIEDWTIYNNKDNTKTGSFSEKYLKGQE